MGRVYTTPAPQPDDKVTAVLLERLHALVYRLVRRLRHDVIKTGNLCSDHLEDTVTYPGFGDALVGDKPHTLPAQPVNLPVEPGQGTRPVVDDPRS